VADEAPKGPVCNEDHLSRHCANALPPSNDLLKGSPIDAQQLPCDPVPGIGWIGQEDGGSPNLDQIESVRVQDIAPFAASPSPAIRVRAERSSPPALVDERL
jgi:hypothetical protein